MLTSCRAKTTLFPYYQKFETNLTIVNNDVTILSVPYIIIFDDSYKFIVDREIPMKGETKAYDWISNYGGILYIVETFGTNERQTIQRVIIKNKNVTRIYTKF